MILFVIYSYSLSASLCMLKSITLSTHDQYQPVDLSQRSSHHGLPSNPGQPRPSSQPKVHRDARLMQSACPIQNHSLANAHVAHSAYVLDLEDVPYCSMDTARISFETQTQSIGLGTTLASVWAQCARRAAYVLVMFCLMARPHQNKLAESFCVLIIAIQVEVLEMVKKY